MKILISGICGFVGSSLARELIVAGHQILGFDNFIRPGSEANRAKLKQIGAKIYHADIRSSSDVDMLPAADWVIDAAANPSVLAGVDGKSSARQLVEHNLGGTVNLLEFCKRHGAGFTLLSTSRVYSITPLAGLSVQVKNQAFCVNGHSNVLPYGVTATGVSESFTTSAPISLYGATKLASEALALEYGETFGFSVFVNRCGVLAGAGQFGRADQGIFTYWINSYLRRRPLKYIGFGGSGHQVRDCLHPSDLISLLTKQFSRTEVAAANRILNVSGGINSACSLANLSAWCASRFGSHVIESDPAPRQFDIPWMVLDSAKAREVWNWNPAISLDNILDEIASHAQDHPNWLDLSAP